MKTRESGMPDEQMWQGFFDPGAMLDALELHPGSGDVVDFGCGYGTFTVAAAAVVEGTVYGIDIEREMVETTRARARAEQRHNVVARRRDFVAEGTGLDSGTAGYAMLFNILHCEEPEALLREAWRVLRSDGRLAVVHWNYDSTTPRGPSMEIRPRPEDCRTWAVGLGFEPLTTEPIPLPPYHYGLVFRKPIA